MEARMNDSNSNHTENGGGPDETLTDNEGIDFISGKSIRENSDTNHHNGHPIEFAMATTTKVAATTKMETSPSARKIDEIAENGGTNTFDLGQHPRNVATKALDVVASTTNETTDMTVEVDETDMTISATTTLQVTPRSSNTATSIPPEFSRTESSSLFVNSGLFVTNSANNGTTSTSTTTTSVTPSRKEELLRQAQADRLAWMRNVSLPYDDKKKTYNQYYYNKLRQTRRRQRQRQRPPQQTLTLHNGEVVVDDDDEDDDDDDIDDEVEMDDQRLQQIWTQDDRLNLFHSSHAVQHLPSVTRILTHLYGLDRHNQDSDEGDDKNKGGTIAKVAARIQSILEPFNVNEEDHALAVPHESSVRSLGNQQQTRNELEDVDFLEAYCSFWSKLTTTECTALVQSMRAFLRNLENSCLAHLHNSTNNDNHSNSADANTVVVERVATSLRTYAESTTETIHAHPAWKGEESDETTTTTTEEFRLLLRRRSLESFLYGHCASLIEKITWDTKSKREEDDWMDRVWSLQFIHAKHLELDCLSKVTNHHNMDTTNDNNTEEAVDPSSWETKLLQRPIQILLSVDCYYSPYEKLQRILAVYRSVNAALAEALNSNRHEQRHDDTSNSNHHNSSLAPKKLPSADDVLPTLILTVIRAQPKRILWNLRMIERFARPEYLRGEAGYAYTNLYGAIQFLQDINITDVEQSSASLSIPPEEFRQGLEASRKAAEERIQATIMASSAKPTKTPSRNHDRAQLSVRAVRQARIEGEAVNLEWAMRWQEDQDSLLTVATPKARSRTLSEHSASAAAAASAQDLSSFPATRSYSFLSTRPEDVRVADLPQLLEEYRTLVHTTERLMALRVSEANSARKKKIASQKSTLLAKVEAVDSGLIQTPTKKQQSKSSKNA